MISRRKLLFGAAAVAVYAALPAHGRLALTNLGGFGSGSGVVSGPGATITTATEVADETNGGMSSSHTVDGGTNCLVVIVRVNRNGSVSSISSVTFGGINLIQRVTELSTNSSSRVRVEIWTLTNPALGAGTIIIVESGDSTSRSFTALNFSGVAVASPVGATAAKNGDGATDHTYTITSTIRDSMLVCGDVTQRAGAAPYTPAAGLIEDADDETTGGGANKDHAYWAGHRSAAKAMTYAVGATANATQNDYAACAIELLPS